MDQLAGIITQPWMVHVFVSIILLVAVRPFCLAVFSIRTVNADLDRATQILKMVGREHLQDEFYNQFKEINSQISKIRGLRHAWREFVDSMYFGNAATSKRVYLSHRPAHYFNRDSVLGTRLNLSQFLAYPGYLIGIGLTFTFIGLAAALHVAQAGLASGVGQQALKDLLAVASIKFISSIVGIASSLIISSLQRIRIMTFQQKLTAFCDLLEDCTEYKSTEKLLHDNFHEQRKHTAILNGLATNIATGIGDVLSNQLSASVANALDPLTQELRSLAQKFVGNCEDALKNVLDEFLIQLRKTSLDDMQGLINSTQTLKGSLETLSVNMESVGSNFGTVTQESAHRLGGMLDSFSTAIAPLQQGIGQFGQTLSSLEALSGKIGQAGDNIRGAAEENNKSSAEFGKTITDLSAKLVSVGELMASLSQSLGKVQETALELKSAGGIIAIAADGFRSSAASIEQAEGRFTQNFSKVDGDLGKALGELTRGSEEFRTGIQAFVTLIDEQFSKAVKGLSGAIKELAAESNLEKKESSYFARLKSKWGK